MKEYVYSVTVTVTNPRWFEQELQIWRENSLNNSTSADSFHFERELIKTAIEGNWNLGAMGLMLTYSAVAVIQSENTVDLEKS